MGCPGSSNAAAADYVDVTSVHILLAGYGNKLKDQHVAG